MSDLVLTARDIAAGYGEENILHGVSIDVPRGAIVAVIGPNGSGKSTLLKTLYGLVPARQGFRRVTPLPRREARALRSSATGTG